MPDVEAAEFAEYLRDERQRRQREPGARAGGMYRRAMMRAYAESVGAELATTGNAAPVDLPTPPLPVDPPSPARVDLPTPPALAMPAPPLQWPQRRAAPPRPLVGLVALALLLIATGVIWGLIDRDPQPPTGGSQAAVGEPSTPPPPVTAAPLPVARPTAPLPAAATRVTAQRSAVPAVGRPRPAAADGTLSITSQPAGARVTVNGVGWGETPVTIRHLEFGPKRIRLTMQGYLSEERVAYLSPGDPAASSRIVLRRRASAPRPRPPVAGAAR